MGYLRKKSYVSRERRVKKQNWRHFLVSHTMKDLKLGCELTKRGVKRRASIRNKNKRNAIRGQGTAQKDTEICQKLAK